MKYNGITWGPSMRGYKADNRSRIARCKNSLEILQNQEGQYAREHRMILAFYADLDALLDKHIAMADEALDAREAIRGGQ